MTTFTGTIPLSVEEFPADLFFNRFAAQRWEMVYPRILKTETTNKAFIEGWEVSGLGTFALKAEGTPIGYDDPVQGNRRRIIMQTFALGIRMTMEMIEDDRWDIAAKLPADLADSARDHMDRLAHGPLNDAFTGTTFLGLDGLALCSAAHTTLKAGAVRTNTLTPGVDLSHAGLEAILTQARTTTDDSGRFLSFRPTTLVIHPNNLNEATRILESEYEPYTAENQVNTMTASRTGMSVVDTPHLNDADDWFVIDRGKHDVRFVTRKSVTPQSGTDMDTLDVKTTSHYRAGAGFFRWEGFYGSNAP